MDPNDRTELDFEVDDQTNASSSVETGREEVPTTTVQQHVGIVRRIPTSYTYIEDEVVPGLYHPVRD